MCTCAWTLSPVRLFVTSQTVALQALYPWDSPGKNTGVGCHSGDLPDPAIEPSSPTLQADSLPSER